MEDYSVGIYTDNPELIPTYATTHSAGMDLKSNEDLVIRAGERILVKTGIRLDIPEGVVGLVHPRSGLALKHGITVLNTPGTIDADYTGEIGVILYNTSDLPFPIKSGDRIAQIVFQNYIPMATYHGGKYEELETNTSRGNGGFGSTGVQ